MIDLHSHVIWGIDDGPADEAAALELARAAADRGTTLMVATPHVDHHYRVDPLQVPARGRELARAVEAAGIPLEVRTGGELSLARARELTDAELDAVKLGGGPYVLLECPHSGQAQMLEPIAFELQARGARILLAHPERSPGVLAEPAILERLVARGALAQVTAGALAGHFGSTVRRGALRLLADGLVHVIASDAHDLRHRKPGVQRALDAVADDVPGMDVLAPWLTEDVPRAILDGTFPPERPETPPRRLRDRLFRR